MTALAYLLISLSNCTFFHHYVESYALNPRAIHPDGRLPSTAQAQRRTPQIRQAIFKSKQRKDNDDMRSGSIIILVDGNNIRNSFGFEHMSAIQLTKKMSSWSTGLFREGYAEDTDGNYPQIICVWDGGTKPSSQKALSPTSLAVYSGPDGNADDIIVQCCSYISSHRHCNEHDHDMTVVVFTSDANLANRCQMQLNMMGGNQQLIDYQIYHSVHLRLLLGNDRDNTANADHGICPDWERRERRESVSELQLYLDNAEQQVLGEEGGQSKHYIHHINGWINGGLKGLKVGRVTKGGSILYTTCAND